MPRLALFSLFLACSTSINAAVLNTRQSDSNGTHAVTISQKDADPAARKREVAYRHDNFLYNVSQIGNAAAFPMGKIGEERVALAWDQWQVDRNIITADIQKDVAQIKQAIIANNGTLRTLDDYATVLYKDQWLNASPLKPALGSLTNYTLDSFFGGERLVRPYSLYKATDKDTKLIDISDDEVKKIAGWTIAELLKAGRLFAVDHSYQADQTTYVPSQFNDKYGAPATALFYLDDKKDLLPLGIRTNVGANLTYTPLDAENDWFLAKIIFNVADQFHNQIYHLTATHNVGEALHEAAMRTLSHKHPIMAVLDRLNYQAYSSRPVGEALCFNPMGHWDENFHISQIGCRNFATKHWPTYGAFEPNYLQTDFQARGLVDKSGKSPFKQFPFWDDASKIVRTQRKFFTSFIDAEVRRGPTGPEVEAQGLIPVQSFPVKKTKKVLVDILTHNAWLQVAHHLLNAGDPVRSSLTLPFHPGGLYKPVPEAKGVESIVPFLPNATASITYIGFLASFNRPRYQTMDPPRTLAHEYSGPDFLARFAEKKVKDAADKYLKAMSALGAKNEARKIEKDGMCTGQGIPFCWTALNPSYISWFFSV
ncbi:Lipoxygenase [Karstenula rhodostoma CBS 690.94]|uniref:Manganese lipoxygenase n=1 Tax=Karstenula rhodostoma CBS 690.94 TaxID=1392251 RepID=A0A9P4PUS2_9PLEO|nr:Lipoxygenase [Karstenula rhodostoma CBS 690.94]